MSGNFTCSSLVLVHTPCDSVNVLLRRRTFGSILVLCVHFLYGEGIMILEHNIIGHCMFVSSALSWLVGVLDPSRARLFVRRKPRWYGCETWGSNLLEVVWGD